MLHDKTLTEVTSRLHISTEKMSDVLF